MCHFRDVAIIASKAECKTCKGTGSVLAVTGEALRKARESAGVLALSMATRLNLSRSYISDIERGKRQCPERVLREYEKL